MLTRRVPRPHFDFRYARLEAVYAELGLAEQSEWCRHVLARGRAAAAKLTDAAK